MDQGVIKMNGSLVDKIFPLIQDWILPRSKALQGFRTRNVSWPESCFGGAAAGCGLWDPQLGVGDAGDEWRGC